MAPLPNPNRITAYIQPQGEAVTWISTPANHATCQRYLKEPLARMARIGALTWSDLHTILTGQYSGIGIMAARGACLDLLEGGTIYS